MGCLRAGHLRPGVAAQRHVGAGDDLERAIEPHTPRSRQLGDSVIHDPHTLLPGGQPKNQARQARRGRIW
jgi:hypothetical protein